MVNFQIWDLIKKNASWWRYDRYGFGRKNYLRFNRFTCNKHEVFPCTKPDGFPDASWENHKQDLLIASRELTYPTWGKEHHHPTWGTCDRSQEGTVLVYDNIGILVLICFTISTGAGFSPFTVNTLKLCKDPSRTKTRERHLRRPMELPHDVSSQPLLMRCLSSPWAENAQACLVVD